MIQYRHIIFLLLSALVWAGCGRQYHAQKTIEDFLEKYARTTSFSVQNISQLDSTRHITDSVIMILQQQAIRNPLFKKNITFGSRVPKTKVLVFTRVIYTTADNQNDLQEHQQTFYLTSDLREVVALKEN